jgi:hypothetical protein
MMMLDLDKFRSFIFFLTVNLENNEIASLRSH